VLSFVLRFKIIFPFFAAWELHFNEGKEKVLLFLGQKKRKIPFFLIGPCLCHKGPNEEQKFFGSFLRKSFSAKIVFHAIYLP
jgi:hypothetical protein